MEENNLIETESTPVETTPNTPTEGQSSTTPDYVELDPKLKYKYGDFVGTADDIKNGQMRHSDYTKKTQEVAKEREYIANLQYDLDAVKRNPQLAAQFKQIYPKQYHNYLRYVTEQTTQATSSPINPEMEQTLAETKEFMEQYKAERTQSAAESAQKEVDAAFDKYTPKYPYADEAAVVSEVSHALNQKRQKASEEGKDPYKERLTEKEWEACFSSVHQRIEKRFQELSKTKFDRQRDVSNRLKDVPSGGGVPGQKPNMPKTIKEAKAMMMRDLAGE